MPHWIIEQLIDLAWVTGIAAAVVAPFLAYPRSRRVIVTVVKFTIRKVPARYRWVLLLTRIPTPFEIDDIIAFAILAYPIFRHRRNRVVLMRCVRRAWRG